MLLSLFLLNYLSQFWHPLDKIAFLSPLHYHRPVNVLGNGAWPWKDMGVLLTSGCAMWLAGGASLVTCMTAAAVPALRAARLPAAHALRLR